MHCELIAECATNHGGDLGLACDMIAAAAEAGATECKFQSYQTKHLNPADPQYDWLRVSELTDWAHERLMKACDAAGVHFLTTVFCLDDLKRAKCLGVERFKVGHGESSADWWYGLMKPILVSWPWGQKKLRRSDEYWATHLSVVPIYPTPLEALTNLTLLDGYSDHSEGLTAAKWAIANGARVIEKHFGFRDRGRWQSWNMDVPMLRELRDWADQMAVIQAGTRNSERWTWKGHTKIASATD